MKDITKKYTNGEVTVVWKPNLCIHSRNCFNGLSQVFDPNKRPWVDAEGASTEQIVDQIKKCPSGALSFFMNDEPEEKSDSSSVETIVEPAPNGPLMVYGSLTVKSADGTTLKRDKVTAFCRCGGSGNKPYCDGSHKKIDFRG
ncbi:MAG: (4Fe-4S)-binding protein [Cyclobacteriaceae bacterium]